MATEDRHPGIAAHSSQPLVAIFVANDSDDVCYFLDDEDTPSHQPSADAQAALSVIGAWSDLDWDELADQLDRIRHASPPTPPIDGDEL